MTLLELNSPKHRKPTAKGGNNKRETVATSGALTSRPVVLTSRPVEGLYFVDTKVGTTFNLRSTTKSTFSTNKGTGLCQFTPYSKIGTTLERNTLNNSSFFNFPRNM